MYSCTPGVPGLIKGWNVYDMLSKMKNKDTSGVNLYIYVVSFLYNDFKNMSWYYTIYNNFTKKVYYMVSLYALFRFYRKIIASIDPKVYSTYLPFVICLQISR